MRATSGITGSLSAQAAAKLREGTRLRGVPASDDLLPLPSLGITLRVVPYGEWAACPPPSARPAPRAALPEQDRRAWRPGPLTLVTTAALTACSTVSDPPRWEVHPTSRIDGTSKAAAVQVHVDLAREHEQQGRWRQAAEALGMAAMLDPTSAEVQTALGVALARDGQSAAAVAAFRRATALDPGSARALNNLGHALALAGQFHEAAEVLRMALAVAPGHARARLNLAEVERRLQAAAAPAQPLPEPPTAMLNPVRLVVVNGVGIDRAAARVAQLLQRQGTPMTAKPRLQNLAPYRVRTTEVQFRKGFEAEAAAIVGQLQQKAQLKEMASGSMPGDVRVVLGHDQRPWLARAHPGKTAAS